MLLAAALRTCSVQVRRSGTSGTSLTTRGPGSKLNSTKRLHSEASALKVLVITRASLPLKYASWPGTCLLEAGMRLGIDSFILDSVCGTQLRSQRSTATPRKCNSTSTMGTEPRGYSWAKLFSSITVSPQLWEEWLSQLWLCNSRLFRLDSNSLILSQVTSNQESKCKSSPRLLTNNRVLKFMCSLSQHTSSQALKFTCNPSPVTPNLNPDTNNHIHNNKPIRNQATSSHKLKCRSASSQAISSL